MAVAPTAAPPTPISTNGNVCREPVAESAAGWVALAGSTVVASGADVVVVGSGHESVVGS